MERCTLILENNHSKLLSLKVEHGLSIFIESQGESYLFDCGFSNSILSNAPLLNKDLDNVNTLILSHSHYDHAAGAKYFIEKYGSVNLIVGKGFFNPKYSKENEVYTYKGSGFDENYLRDKQIEPQICFDTIAINSKLSVVGNFKRYKEYNEIIPNRFMLREKDGNYIRDNFDDEIALVYDDGDYLTLIVGCSHPGILSMCRGVNKKFNKRVKRIFGGIHLNKASDARLKNTIKILEDLGVEEVGLSHCSGKRISELIDKESSKIKAHIIGTGDEFKLWKEPFYS